MILATESDADSLVTQLLDLEPNAFTDGIAARIRPLKAELMSKLVEAGRQFGCRMSSLLVLENVLGEETAATALLAGDVAPLAARIAGIDHGALRALAARRRWKVMPLVVYERTLFGLTFSFVVARGKRENGDFQRYWLYDKAMSLLGATEAARKTLRGGWGHNGQRLRVLLGGRVERVFCMPEWITLQLARLLARRPEWTRPEARPLLAEVGSEVTAASKQCALALLGKEFEKIVDGPPNP